VKKSICVKISIEITGNKKFCQNIVDEIYELLILDEEIDKFAKNDCEINLHSTMKSTREE